MAGPSEIEQPSGVEQEAQLLSEFAEIPGISAAWVTPGGQSTKQITAQYAQRDIPANKLRKYLRTFSVPEDPKGPVESNPSFPLEMKDVLVHSVSPSGKNVLVVRAGSEGESAMLEVWKGSRLFKELRVPKDLHGSIYNDNWFSLEPAWRHDEDCIAYVAEGPVPANSKTPEWGSRASKEDDGEAAKSKAPKAGPKGWRGVGEFREDWGELNTGKSSPKLFVLDIRKGEVTAVSGMLDDSSVGQPVWTPDGTGLIFVSWPHKALNFPKLPQRLGIVFCANRPCFLYHVSLDQADPTAERIETGLSSGLNPKFSPDGSHLYFLAHEEAVTTGAHHGSLTLERVTWPSQGKRQTIIGVVRSPKDDQAFPGLFTAAARCLVYAFVSSSRILMTSQWRSTIKVLDVALAEDGATVDVSKASDTDGPCPSAALLAVHHGLAVAIQTGPRSPPRLVIANLSHNPLQWQPINSEEEPYSERVSSFLQSSEKSHHIIQVKPTTGDSKLAMEAVVLMSKNGGSKAPTVLVPHGGPHSAYPAAYILSFAYLNALGYNVLQVNYRGSTGFGEDSLQSLLGHIGSNDVSDCVAALDEATEQGFVDPDRVAVIGGSHGGFLTAHLLGQHPDRFKAGVLRNPVLDLALMPQISDIPDWVYVEAFGSQDGLNRASVKPSFDEMQHFTAVSPVSHIANVKAPMLFMLGAKDRRVVMRDSQQYVAAMNALPEPVETRTIVYPNDTHALDQPQTEFEQWINAAWWLKRFV